MRRERSFVPRLPTGGPSVAFREQLLLEMTARLPNRTTWAPDEVLLVSLVVQTFEAEGADHVAWVIRKCGLPVPPKIRHDRYRLIKYLLRDWSSPTVRERILTKTMHVPIGALRRQFETLTPERALQIMRQSGAPYLITPLRIVGLDKEADALFAMLDEEGRALYRCDVLTAQIIAHRLWREADPAASTLRDRRILTQRLRRRTHKLQALRRSLYQLGQERKALVRLAWEAEQAAGQVLDHLIAQQSDLEARLAGLIMAHAERLATIQAKQAAEVQAARERLETRRAEYAEALAERRRWASRTPLTGQNILVVGDLNHDAGYRAVIEEMGGRAIIVDGLDRLGRIREVAPEADVAILISATAKHAAEATLASTLSPACIFLYCPRSGQASLERTIRTDLLPRQSSRRVAASQQGGDQDDR